MNQPVYCVALIVAACFNAAAALLHLGCLAFGARWYRALGAGDRVVAMVNAKRVLPYAMTAAIAAMLLIWALYALSAAGCLGPMPFMRWVLVFIAAVYLGRGLLGLCSLSFRGHFQGTTAMFWQVSSWLCVAVGVLHLIGIAQVWPLI